ncbi:hypothetical protein [Streptomyces sp. NPDC047097]|uniref:hypothetical protein n=1 Tax=Streptomyces sp. NPDC047097 TaxID=3155260 RepID=UPI0033F7D06F
MDPDRFGAMENISLSLPSHLLGELRARAGRRGLSGYITEAVRHRFAMDGLAEIVTTYESEHGALTVEEIAAAQRELFGRDTATDGERDPA